MYEPAVEFGKCNHPSQFKYLFDKPTVLPKYLEHFSPPDGSIEIEEGPEVEQCIGIDGVNKPHIFLKAEGSYICSRCEKYFAGLVDIILQKTEMGKERKVRFTAVMMKNMILSALSVIRLSYLYRRISNHPSLATKKLYPY